MDIKDFMAYPARFEPAEEGGFTVIVSGIDGAISEGDDMKGAKKAAVAVIADMANYLLDEKRPIPPAPAPTKGEMMVHLPIVMALKLVLRNEMLAQKVSLSELARRMGMSAQLLGQTLDLTRTRTSIDALDSAFRAIGKTLKMSVD